MTGHRMLMSKIGNNKSKVWIFSFMGHEKASWKIMKVFGWMAEDFGDRSCRKTKAEWKAKTEWNDKILISYILRKGMTEEAQSEGTVRKQRAMSAVLSLPPSFSLSRAPDCKMLSSCRMGHPSSANLIWIILHRHTQRLMYRASLDYSVKLTTDFCNHSML